MAVRTHLTTGVPAAVASEAARPYQEGITAGIIGAATITLWGLVVDVVTGRLFYTASALGTALFDHSMPFDAVQKAPVSMEMAMMFIWLRALAFMAIGGLAAPLLHGLMWPVALVGNLFAATAMAGYFRRCHPQLTMHP